MQPILARAVEWKKGKPSGESTISSQVSAPVLLMNENVTRALALDSVTLASEPFSATELIPFNLDSRTRVMMFAQNLDFLPGENASSVTADAEDSSLQHYGLTVEYVGNLQLPPSALQPIKVIILRLNDAMLNITGDVNVRIYFHGMVSNPAPIAIRSSPLPTPTPTPAPTPSGNTVTVNAAITYQTMTGWEATAQVGYPDFTDWDAYKNTLMDMAAADGINRLRLEIQLKNESPVANATSPTNDNSDPFVINWAGFHFDSGRSIIGGKKLEAANMLRARLAARGEPMPYVVLCYVDFASQDGFSFYHHNNPEEYAELIEAAFLTIFNQSGWVPDAVEIILEPDNGYNNLWTPAKIANNIMATGNRLAAHGWNPRFIVPAVTNCPNGANWYNNIKAANPAVMAYIDELAYHRYGMCTDSALAANKGAAEADGNRLSMTEFIGATHQDLHKDLKANAVSWQQYTIAYDSNDNNAHYYVVNHNTHSVTISNQMKFLRQYFKFVRRGAVRLEAVSGNASFDPVAFRNTNGGQVVVVKAASGGSFNIQGLAAGTYGIKYTTATQYDIDATPVTINAGQLITTSIPDAGVITVYGT